MNVLEQGPNFRSLSIRDLLEARDQYHYHLLNKANVVGTAIGLYLIRNKDEDEDDKSTPRTLSNSRVRQDSWPCVLVFLRNWLRPSDFIEGGAAQPTDMLPKTLYMPDGRAVPVCVVQALEVPAGDPTPPAPSNGLPAHKLGGGMPIMVGDDTIGAIGLSGAVGGQDKEEACAKAGIAKVADQLK